MKLQDLVNSEHSYKYEIYRHPQDISHFQEVLGFPKGRYIALVVKMEDWEIKRAYGLFSLNLKDVVEVIV